MIRWSTFHSHWIAPKSINFPPNVVFDCCCCFFRSLFHRTYICSWCCRICGCCLHRFLQCVSAFESSFPIKSLVILLLQMDSFFRDREKTTHPIVRNGAPSNKWNENKNTQHHVHAREKKYIVGEKKNWNKNRKKARYEKWRARTRERANEKKKSLELKNTWTGHCVSVSLEWVNTFHWINEDRPIDLRTTDTLQSHLYSIGFFSFRCVHWIVVIAVVVNLLVLFFQLSCWK